MLNLKDYCREKKKWNSMNGDEVAIDHAEKAEKQNSKEVKKERVQISTKKGASRRCHATSSRQRIQYSTICTVRSFFTCLMRYEASIATLVWELHRTVAEVSVEQAPEQPEPLTGPCTSF